jgi:hypothetical protein
LVYVVTWQFSRSWVNPRVFIITVEAEAVRTAVTIAVAITVDTIRSALSDLTIAVFVNGVGTYICRPWVYIGIAVIAVRTVTARAYTKTVTVSIFAIRQTG